MSSKPTDDVFDVAVIGLGTMGAATAYEVARRGASVLGLEQFAIPHALGSHHGDSRMIRLCYYEHPSYVPLLLRAHDLWCELQEVSGRSLFHITGALFMGEATEDVGDLVPGSLRAAAEHGLEHERLSGTALADQYPMFHLPPRYEGVFEPNAGILRPEVVIEAYADLALRHGAVLRGHEPVLGWKATNRSVSIQTATASYRAARLVICGGAWASDLLGTLEVPLRVTRQVLGWFWPRDPEEFEMDRFSVWGMDDPQNPGGLLYGFPLLPGSGRPGLKIARHLPAKPTTPNRTHRMPNQDDRNEIEQIILDVFPKQAGPLLSLAICLYTNTPDAHFVIDTHPEHTNVTFAAGFSGHGFKFASVFGEVLADLALAGGTQHPIEFLGLARFDSGKTIR